MSLSKRRAHRGHQKKSAATEQGNTPCEACRAQWVRFEETGDSGKQLFHGTCLDALCGPRTSPPAETLVKRKVPQPIKPGTRGWWEQP